MQQSVHNLGVDPEMLKLAGSTGWPIATSFGNGRAPVFLTISF